MTTFTVLIGFGLMLFLPCALTVLSIRNGFDSDYSDRIVDPSGLSLVEPQETSSVEVWPDFTEQDFEEPAPLVTLDMEDSQQATLPKLTRQARIQRSEMEALLATAAAARAQAEALAANARLAAIRAEAADAEAAEAEEAAAAALQEIRRAA